MMKSSNEICQTSVPRTTVEVHLPDGRILCGPRNRPIAAFLKGLPEWNQHDPIMGAVVNGELRELTHPVKLDSRVRLVTMSDPDGSGTIAIMPRTWPTFSPRCAAANRWWKTRCSACARPVRRCWPTPATTSGRSVVGIRRRWSAYETPTDYAARAAAGGRRRAGRAGQRCAEQAAHGALRCAYSAAQGELAREGHAGRPPGLRRHRAGSGVAEPAGGGDPGAACGYRRGGQRDCGIDSAFWIRI